jgi:hypothetical protein
LVVAGGLAVGAIMIARKAVKGVTGMFGGGK